MTVQTAWVFGMGIWIQMWNGDLAGVIWEGKHAEFASDWSHIRCYVAIYLLQDCLITGVGSCLQSSGEGSRLARGKVISDTM